MKYYCPTSRLIVISFRLIYDADIFHSNAIAFKPVLDRNVETYRHSCMSFQSLTLGWLALVQALEEYQERPLSPSSPLAGMPDTQREGERERHHNVSISEMLFLPHLTSASFFAPADETKPNPASPQRSKTSFRCSKQAH